MNKEQYRKKLEVFSWWMHCPDPEIISVEKAEDPFPELIDGLDKMVETEIKAAKKAWEKAKEPATAEEPVVDTNVD